MISANSSDGCNIGNDTAILVKSVTVGWPSTEHIPCLHVARQMNVRLSSSAKVKARKRSLAHHDHNARLIAVMGVTFVLVAVHRGTGNGRSVNSLAPVRVVVRVFRVAVQSVATLRF